MNAPPDLAELFRWQAQGRVEESEAGCRAALKLQPGRGELWHLLGTLRHRRGDFREAAQCLERAAFLRPRDANVWCNLGGVRLALQDAGGAANACRQAVVLDAGLARAWYNLGVAETALGNTAAAEAALRRALELDPCLYEAANNLGNLLHRQGRFRDAAAWFDRAAALRPEAFEAWYNRANNAAALGEREEARRSYEKAVALDPDQPDVHFNHARLLFDLRDFAGAAAANRRALQRRPGDVRAMNNLAVALKELGDLHGAVEQLEAARGIAPDDPDTCYNLGNVHLAADRPAAAAACYRQALALKPEWALALINLGAVLRQQGANGEAESCFRRAIASAPQSPEAWSNLGSLIHGEGRAEEALSCYRRALELRPDFQDAHSNLLLALNYSPQTTAVELLEQHVSWAARHAPAPLPPPARPPHDPLRIGYVSPDFRNHSVARFLEPILAHHDRGRVCVYLYSDVAAPDEVTQRLYSHASCVRSTAGLQDDELDARIRSDEIDLLIDLAGHTAGNRIRVFARQPAPRQAAYLGYGATSGLRAMHFRITDAVMDPPGEPRRHTEELIRLPGCSLCYRPPENAPVPERLPARRTGGLTFGSFHNLAKLSAPTLDAWCRILQGVPGSRLLLKARPFGDPEVRERLLREMARRGIAAERIELAAHAAGLAQHLAIYNRVDLALDPFPYGGATTTCEALWMGVPVVTLRGDRYVGRMTASLLTALGQPGWIAESVDDYVALGIAWAGRADELDRLRRELREVMAASPLCDGAAFTRRLEDAYVAMTESPARAEAPPS